MVSGTIPKGHEFANGVSKFDHSRLKKKDPQNHPCVLLHPKVHLSFACLNLAPALWGVFIVHHACKAAALTDFPMVQSKIIREQMLFFFVCVCVWVCVCVC